MGVTNVDQLDLDDFGRTGFTATATAGAATLNTGLGVITTESLTTAGAAEYTLTLSNTKIKADSVVFATVGKGTSAAGSPAIGECTVSANQVIITVTNLSSNAFDGTLKIGFIVFNQVD